MILTLEDIKKKLKKHKPEGEVDLLTLCEFPLQFIGEGAFRNVYRIVGTEYVLKVSNCGEDGIDHAVTEYEAWSRLKRRKKFEPIRHMLPEFHYFNVQTGIALVNHYSKVTESSFYRKSMKEVHEFLIRNGFNDPDLYSSTRGYGYKADNYGLDKDGELKIIDFGCVC